MIYKIFAERDTFVTDAQRNSTQQTGSNVGASEILEVFKKAGVSGSTTVLGSASLARTLMKFDLSSIAALTASGQAPSTGSTYFLRMYDARHSDTLPTSYSMEVYPISGSWDEGAGIDVDTYLDKGFANWDKAEQSRLWATPGGDFFTGSMATVSFDRGNEDIEIDISNIVGAWLTGGLPNEGIMLKLTEAEETDSADYFRKKFHGRETNFRDKRPVIEARWDDSRKDDRDNFVFDTSNTLYLYNKKKGALTDISGIGVGSDAMTINIVDASGTLVTVSGSHTGVTGIYSSSFTFATGSYSGSVFNDVWFSGSTTYMTGTFYPYSEGAFQSIDQQEYIVSIKNMKRNYTRDEKVRFDLFIRTRNYNPAVVQTASLDMSNTVITKGYYRIDNATTNQQVIPLGTGSVETTRLSYDNDGNYFEFYMRSLSEREVYKVLFFLDVDGQLQMIDRDIRFRVL